MEVGTRAWCVERKKGQEKGEAPGAPRHRSGRQYFAECLAHVAFSMMPFLMNNNKDRDAVWVKTNDVMM